MQAELRVNGFSGTILLARKGAPIVAKGYGPANAEWSIPNTPRTKFRLGSITKQFTSMAVMQLQQQGKLKVQDPICQYLTPCPEAWKPITIHHLLTHTSGIPSYTNSPSYMATMMVPKTVEQMVAGFRDLPLEFEPGRSTSTTTPVLSTWRAARKSDRTAVRARARRPDLHSARHGRLGLRQFDADAPVACVR